MKAIATATVCRNGAAEQTVWALPERTDDGSQETNLINVYPDVRYQTVEGFGGAVTEAVGDVLANLPERAAGELLESCFGEDGLRYSIVRTHVDSCDFSLSDYSAVTDPADTALSSFSIARDEQRVIPWIRAAQTHAKGALAVMLTPWSPPAFMKTNGRRNCGGKLKCAYYDVWAAYLCKYIQAYMARGLQVRMLSIQNEPNAAQQWESCVFSASEERAFLRDHLHPALVGNGLSDVGVYIWDHNKERLFDRVVEIVGEETETMLAGAAFHWYSGDHFDAVRLVSEKYPELKLLFSEAVSSIGIIRPANS
jgi:glucosylceramidase